jgi:Domain of unknown function (DUF1735)
MRIHSIRLSLIVTLTLSITAISCLKDKAFDNGTIQSGSQGSGQDAKVISLGITVSSTSNFLQASYPITGSDTTVNLVPVELGGTSDATSDIHVTLTVDDSLLDAYNNANGTNLVDAGPVATILNNGVVTIPSGSRIGYLQVKFNASDLLAANYAVPVKITSVAESGYTISGNLYTGIVAIGPKNQYDGHYKSQGVFTHPAYGVLTWDYSNGITQDLITSGPNSVYFFPTNTSIGGFGVEMDITVNPDNTLVEVFNGVTTPTPNSDHYDPATKTFYISGAYMGASGPRTYQATLLYAGPR